VVLNTRKRGLVYIVQRKGIVIQIIKRAFSGTLATILRVIIEGIVVKCLFRALAII
jgi:hypothetical protein